MISQAAKHYPQYDFILIGQVTCEIKYKDIPANVKFLGEIPYHKLTGYLHFFDVCLIPFKLIQLTLCTNPVKVYEYLAAGKPVVCTAMPEVELISDMVHIGYTNSEFIDNIEVAMNESTDIRLQEVRKSWAKGHAWASRARQLNTELLNLDSKKLKVSIIVLTYNNLDYTKNCLESLVLNTEYDNYEIILVDSNSVDGTKDYLKENYSRNKKFKVILNDENLGFAAGNNIGLKVATG
ncbi:MAG: Putative teichuronic acid biosynthesis glycosyltransferase TuaH [Candidatus Erwinia impunctatus]|nr:Putative teichuronic acid biosynthesis glycosyltransferase TuaH [Culicoides impunctatus]